MNRAVVLATALLVALSPVYAKSSKAPVADSKPACVSAEKVAKFVPEKFPDSKIAYDLKGDDLKKFNARLTEKGGTAPSADAVDELQLWENDAFKKTYLGVALLNGCAVVIVPVPKTLMEDNSI